MQLSNNGRLLQYLFRTYGYNVESNCEVHTAKDKYSLIRTDFHK